MTIAGRIAVAHLREAVDEGEACATYVRALERVAAEGAYADEDSWRGREFCVYELAKNAAHHAREWQAYASGAGAMPQQMSVV